MIIKSHKELAKIIRGKRIMHLNSLGKDCAITLDWLCNFAEPSEVWSVYFQYFWSVKDDESYLEYQKKKYPNVRFLVEPNPNDLTNVLGIYQSPIGVLKEINHLEHQRFDINTMAMELLASNDFDYLCIGFARYESMSRASDMNKNGLLQDRSIFPIGMMSKKEIYDLLKSRQIKLHPFYKLAPKSPDYPSYYKLRSLLLTNAGLAEEIYKFYPLLRLDEHRWENLLND